MHILFLDTETSGLSSVTDSVIEIAGVLVDFDPASIDSKIVSSFNSLIRLETELDPKISRITDIYPQDLQSAPNRLSVQQLWSKWLNENHSPDNQLLICGHSIDFDLGFLRNERWYLPDSIRLIDTLDLCKILVPDSEAVNLEYLMQSFDDIDPLRSKLTRDEVRGLKAHRALFDTYAAYLLFLFLIKRLLTIPFDPVVGNVIQNTFVPLGIELYPQPFDAPSDTPASAATLELRIDGTLIRPSLDQQLLQCYHDATLDQLVVEIAKANDPLIIRILCQIYGMLIFKRLYPNKSLKYHARGASDFLLLRICLDAFAINASTPEVAHIYYFEDILSKIDSITQYETPLHELVELLDLFIKFNTSDRDNLNPSNYSLVDSEKNSELNKHITKLISSYDFLLLTLQAKLVYSEYLYNANNSDADSLAIGARLDELLKLIKTLPENIENPSHIEDNQPTTLSVSPTNQTTSIRSLICSRITSLRKSIITKLHFPLHGEFILKAYNNNLKICVERPECSPETIFRELSTSYAQVIIHSYLQMDSITQLRQILGIPDIDSVSYSSETNETAPLITIQHQTIDELIDQYTSQQFGENIVLKPNQINILITGQNSTYKQTQHAIIEKLTSSQYLMVGESGSISKVTSKLNTSFAGVVLLKLSEADFLMRLNKQLSIGSIVFVLEPFWFVKKYFRKYSSNELAVLKQLHCESIYNKFFTKWKTPITIIQNP